MRCFALQNLCKNKELLIQKNWLYIKKMENIWSDHKFIKVNLKHALNFPLNQEKVRKFLKHLDDTLGVSAVYVKCLQQVWTIPHHFNYFKYSFLQTRKIYSASFKTSGH